MLRVLMSASLRRTLQPNTVLRSSVLHQAAAAAPFSRRLSSSPIPFTLSDIGEGIAEVEVLQYFVQAGDVVEEFDKLVEVQSDKATVEITSPRDGRIHSIAYAVGDVAPTGTHLLFFENDGAATPEAANNTPQAPAPAPASPSPAAAAGVGPGESKVVRFDESDPVLQLNLSKPIIAPAARGLMAENGLSHDQITGSGKHGIINKSDVVTYLKSAASKPAAPAVPPPAAAPAAPPVFSATPAVEDRTVPIKGIQKAMFAQMTAANSVPSFLYADEVCMDNLIETRQRMKAGAQQLGVERFTFMPLLIKALSLSLTQHPILNSQIGDGGTTLIYKASHNISFAVDTPNGLLVPNVKGVQDKSVLQIALELQDLQTLTSKGSIAPAQLKGGTFTLSNIGNLGGTYNHPVVNPPEVAIGGLGKTRPSPRVNHKGEIVVMNMMQVSWSGDHRIIDGATMARFSNTFIGFLEQPDTMLLHL